MADMIINPTRNVLEFASAGKSLLRVRVKQAVIDALLHEIRTLPICNRPMAINRTFLHYQSLKESTNG